jgi:hypothetical protein
MGGKTMNELLLRRRVARMEEPLPQGAVKIEYLESSGTQWIDTGLPLNTEYTIEVRFRAYKNNNNNISILGFYLRNRSGNIMRCSRFFWQSAYNRFIAQYKTSSVTVVKSGEGELGQWHTVTIGNDKILYDGSSVNGSRGSDINDTDHTQLLFCSLSYDSERRPQVETEWPAVGNVVDISYAKYTYNGNTLREYIPVSVGTTGYLYDKVSGQLFGNAGTGDFILGQDK